MSLCVYAPLADGIPTGLPAQPRQPKAPHFFPLPRQRVGHPHRPRLFSSAASAPGRHNSPGSWHRHRLGQRRPISQRAKPWPRTVRTRRQLARISLHSKPPFFSLRSFSSLRSPASSSPPCTSAWALAFIYFRSPYPRSSIPSVRLTPLLPAISTRSAFCFSFFSPLASHL